MELADANNLLVHKKPIDPAFQVSVQPGYQFTPFDEFWEDLVVKNPKCPSCQKLMRPLADKIEAEDALNPFSRPSWICDHCGETFRA